MTTNEKIPRRATNMIRKLRRMGVEVRVVRPTQAR